MYVEQKFNPLDFLDLVNNSIECALSDSDSCNLINNEAFHRTLIGRSYYSVYLRLKATLFKGKKYVKHSVVINELKSRQCYNIAFKLNTLKRLREEADYNLYDSIGREVLERAYDLAWDLHRLIDNTYLYQSKY